MSDLSNPIFHDETKAREWLEGELWPEGPICPKCGTVGEATLMQGKSHRPGLYQCNSCREPFTVTVGTLYERSKVPLNKWFAANHLLIASKKGMSALQIGRLLGLSKKTAWFLCHRIRESLRKTNPDMLGGDSKIVEFDESFVGGKEANKHRFKRNKKNMGGRGKESVFALLERGGNVRSHHMPDVSAKTLRPILEAQIKTDTRTMNDDGGARVGHDRPFHQSVNHSAGEYVGGEAHTNTAGGYFSIVKRGINGVYHHASQQHLKRYLAAFDFRYNERSSRMLSAWPNRSRVSWEASNVSNNSLRSLL
jgi:transposase-like protein